MQEKKCRVEKKIPNMQVLVINKPAQIGVVSLFAPTNYGLFIPAPSYLLLSPP